MLKRMELTETNLQTKEMNGKKLSWLPFTPNHNLSFKRLSNKIQIAISERSSKFLNNKDMETIMEITSTE